MPRRVSSLTVAALLTICACILAAGVVIDPSETVFISSLVSVLGLIGLVLAAEQGPRKEEEGTFVTNPSLPSPATKQVSADD